MSSRRSRWIGAALAGLPRRRPVPNPPHFPLSPDRTNLLDLIRRYGRTTTSFQTLEPGMSHYCDDDGCVGFVDTGRAWVAAGEPIVPPARVASMSRKFRLAARAAGRRPSFFSVAASAAEWDEDLALLPIGREPWWSLEAWPGIASAHRSIHGQVRRAENAGVTITHLDSERIRSSDHLRASLDRLIDEWLDARQMPAMEFLVDLQPWTFPEERIYLAARHRERWVGLLVAIPIYGRDAWFFEDLIRSESAPNGTSEALVDAAMREARRRGASEATMGLVPLAGDRSWQRITRTIMGDFYNFDGIHRFKSKLRPTRWEPVFLAYPSTTGPVLAVYDVLDGFALGSINAFGADAVRRNPRFILRVIAFLLLPWIGFLLWSDPERWFPSKRARNGWVVFDLAVATGLFRLLHRWDGRLATVLTAAVSADVVVSSAQVTRARRERTILETALSVAMIAAPALTAVVLWKEKSRQERRQRQRKRLR